MLKRFGFYDRVLSNCGSHTKQPRQVQSNFKVLREAKKRAGRGEVRRTFVVLVIAWLAERNLSPRFDPCIQPLKTHLRTVICCDVGEALRANNDHGEKPPAVHEDLPPACVDVDASKGQKSDLPLVQHLHAKKWH